MPRDYKSVARALAPAIFAVICAHPVYAQLAEPNVESRRAIEDLRLRESAYFLSLQQHFSGITQLGPALKQGEVQDRRVEAILALATQYLAYGSYAEADRLLEQLSGTGTPSAVPEQLWLNLARLYYARGQFALAESVLLRLAGLPAGKTRSERDYLLANVYIASNRDKDAITLLKGLHDSSEWMAYGRYNLALTLIKGKQTQDEGMAILDSLAEATAQGGELKALRDQINLRLGYARLESNDFERAKKAFLRVPADSPFTSKALLGLGWAERGLGRTREALVSWGKLVERRIDDESVLEALLVVPYTQNQLKEYAQAVASYQRAIAAYEIEIKELENALAALRSGDFTRTFFAVTPETGEQGWNWTLETLPDIAAMRPILPLLASHDFQAAMKTHRDLRHLEKTVELWGRDLEAYASLVQARDQSFRDKLPRSLSFSKQFDAAVLQERVKELKKELTKIEANTDVFALANEEEMKQLARVRRAELLLKKLTGEIMDADELQNKYQLLRGMLFWNLHAGYKEKLLETKKAVQELEQAVDAASRDQARLRKAATDAALGSGGHSDMIRELQVRQKQLINRTRELLSGSEASLRAQLNPLLERRRSRIAEYLVQANFGIAQAQEQAANKDKDGGKGLAIAAYRKLLAMNGEIPHRPEIMRHLAQLEFEQADMNLLQPSKPEAGKAQGISIQDGRDISYQDVIQRYRQLLEIYPNDPQNEQMLYQLAKAYDRNGDLDGALDALTRLAKSYPRSKLLDEVQFRRGEMLFSMNMLAEATQAYAAVMALGESSSFFEGAIYKHGWTQYRLGQHGKALDSFLSLLDKKLGTGASGGIENDKLSQHDTELVNDVLRVASLSISSQEGAPTIVKLFASRGHRPYKHRLYEWLAAGYLEQERIKDAADTYHAYVVAYPSDPYAPVFQSKIIAAYKKAGFTSLLLAAKEEFVLNYIPDGGYWQKNPGTDNAGVLADVNAYLQELASHSHARAQLSKLSEDYVMAEKWYRLFLKSFPRDVLASKLNFLLAELLFEAGRYSDAAAEYEHAAYDYPPHDKGAEAGYAALLAYRQRDSQLAGEARDAWRRRAIDSSLRFVEKYPGDARATTVVTKAAEDMFAVRDNERAVSTARRIIDQKPEADAAQRRSAWTIVAHSHFEQRDYVHAEESYKQVLRLTSKQDGDYGAMMDRLAASVYKQGEQAQADNNLQLAVKHYLRIGELAPESSIRPTAEYDAAAGLMILKDWKAAIKVLERFRKTYPEHALQKEVSTKLAVAYLEDGQSFKAAVELESLALAGEQGDLRRDAILQAAELYTKAERADDAARMYERYVQQFPQPIVQAIEVRQRLADYYNREKKTQIYHYWLHDIIAADRDGGTERSDRTQYLAAKAALVLADVANGEFSQVRLVRPLQDNLKTKKDKMEAALTAYNRAAAYGAAEVTTASTYHIAQIYADFSRELMNSERPENLSKDELEQYDLLLEEQASPFEEKSIEVHESNASRTTVNVYDEWVRKSFAALRKLLPARYDKVEQGELYVDMLR